MKKCTKVRLMLLPLGPSNLSMGNGPGGTAPGPFPLIVILRGGAVPPNSGAVPPPLYIIGGTAPGPFPRGRSPWTNLMVQAVSFKDLLLFRVESFSFASFWQRKERIVKDRCIDMFMLPVQMQLKQKVHVQFSFITRKRGHHPRNFQASIEQKHHSQGQIQNGCSGCICIHWNLVMGAKHPS